MAHCKCVAHHHQPRRRFPMSPLTPITSERQIPSLPSTSGSHFQNKSLASILPRRSIDSYPKNPTSFYIPTNKPRHPSIHPSPEPIYRRASGNTLSGKTTSMAWFFGERRGPQWKQGWMSQALSSSSLPPPSLIVILAIVMLFLSISWRMDYKTQLRRTEVGFRLLLLLFPVALIIVARYRFLGGRFGLRLPQPEQESIHRSGSSPWGVALLVVVLLLMISYQSSFHSQWFRPLWRMD